MGLDYRPEAEVLDKWVSHRQTAGFWLLPGTKSN